MAKTATIPITSSVIASLALFAAPASGQDAITRVSVDANGNEGDNDSGFTPSSISPDGRQVAFDSHASNLVPSDTNGFIDVFVHDRLTGAIVRVSIDSAGAQANGDSYWPSLSTDGRFVAFRSVASNLVSGDTNGTHDIFVHDRDPDGNGVFDEGNGVTTLASLSSTGVQGNGSSSSPSISGDGGLVAFASLSDTLVASDTNGVSDVFVRDLTAGTTVRASIDSSGAQANGWSDLPSISGDGSVVAFESQARNLVAGDNNGCQDIFAHELASGVTERASVSSSGNEADGVSYGPSPLSLDGSIVAFASAADNLDSGDTGFPVDVFVRDRAAGTTTRVSVTTSGDPADASSDLAALSADGQVVAFRSFATNLNGNDTNGHADVFAHDRATGATQVQSSASCSSATGDGNSFYPAVSGDGGLVAFASFATNLVTGDTNGQADIFVHDRSLDVHASWSNYGSGFPGTQGVPTLSVSADPVFGSTITIDLSNCYGRWTVALLLVGLTRISVPTSAGGTLLVDPLLVFPRSFSSAGDSLSVTIPYDDALCGVPIELQALEADPGAQHGIAFSPGLELVCGI